MNVLLISQYFWPESVPVNDLALGLVERGHKVTVLTGKPNYPSGSFFPDYGFLRPVSEEYRGIKVLRVPLVPRGPGNRHRLTINYFSFATMASLLGPLLCRGRFDLVFVHQTSPVLVGLPGIVLKKIKRAPMMLKVEDLWPESLSATGAIRSKQILRLVSKLTRYIYRHCDRVLVQSRSFIPRVKALDVEPDNIFYLPNWAEQLYRPMKLDDGALEQEEMPQGFRVMFAGNIGAAQGFGTILEAAEKLKHHSDIHWVIVGEGRMRAWVERRVEESSLGGNVHLLGPRSAGSMPRYFSLADALLVSLRREPIFALTIPSKVQSYLACARPVLATVDGEAARVVEEAGAGLTAPAEDAGALADAVLKLYKAPAEEREAMGKRGRAYFEEHFEREKLLDRLESLMEELIEGKT